GHWQLGSKPSVSARLQASDVKLDWGSITALGVQADVGVRWRPGSIHLDSREPVTIAKLASGIALTDIRFGLNSDLDTWRLHAVSARVLGGRLSARALTWPSSEYQSVELSGIKVEQVVALQ